MRLLRRDPGPMVDVSYRLVHPIVSTFCKLYFDLELRGVDKIPRQGGFILAPNHLSLVDPVFTSLAAGRNVRYLATDQLFGRSRFFDTLTGYWGAIPMPRDRVPVRALRAAIRTLRAGKPVGVYPESRRVDFWGETPPSHGASWLALLTGVPIYPLALEGTEHVLSVRRPKFRRAAVRATVFDPIVPSDFVGHVDPLAAATDVWQESLVEVLGPPRTSR